MALTIADPGREVGIVNLSAGPSELVGVVRDLRIYSGYAGWSPGQLESEIQAGGWLVLDHEAFDPLTSDPATLWNQAASAAASGQGVRALDGRGCKTTSWFPLPVAGGARDVGGTGDGPMAS